MKDSNWMILIGVLALFAALMFFRCKQQRISYFSGSNTIFAMNEFDWIPSDVKTILINRINDDIVPAMKSSIQASWGAIPLAQRTKFLKELNDFFTESTNQINASTITISEKSPTP